jgi:hypothetical protein
MNKARNLLGSNNFSAKMDAKTLEAFSIADFMELARLADGAKDDVEGSERVADAIRGSRFRDLLERPRGPGPKFRHYEIRDRNVGRFVIELRGLIDNLLRIQLTEPNTDQVIVANLTTSRWSVWGTAGERLTLLSEKPSGPDAKSKIIDPVAELVTILLNKFAGADLSRFRCCAYEQCKKAFYAARANSVCCSRRCNNNRLQHKWYRRHGKAEKYQPSQRKGRKG